MNLIIFTTKYVCFKVPVTRMNFGVKGENVYLVHGGVMEIQTVLITETRDIVVSVNLKVRPHDTIFRPIFGFISQLVFKNLFLLVENLLKVISNSN